jgi:hypothetical protein
LTSKDNCRRQWNYEKQLPLGKYIYQLQMAAGQYGPSVVMRTRTQEIVYSRQTGKSLPGE